eukprot:g3139.t1
MSSLRTLLAATLVVLVLSSYAIEAFESEAENSRTLLQKKKKKSGSGKSKKDKEAEAEAKREKEALAAYAAQQAARENEKQKQLKQASKQAADAIADFNNADSEKEQIKVFVDLWRNQAGVVIVKTINTLLSSSRSTRDYYIELLAESMQDAVSRGYAIQVSAGVASALTIVERETDAAPILMAILNILRTRNKARKNSGCIYVKNLMSDAEVSAIENGYENEFTQALDEPRYIPIMECFLDACSGVSLDCCKDKNATMSGVCDCDEKEQRTCTYNVFWRMPRTIWRCSGDSCVSTKCLCPVVKQRPIRTRRTKEKSTKTSNSKATASTKTRSATTSETTTSASTKSASSKSASSKSASSKSASTKSASTKSTSTKSASTKSASSKSTSSKSASTRSASSKSASTSSESTTKKRASENRRKTESKTSSTSESRVSTRSRAKATTGGRSGKD